MNRGRGRSDGKYNRPRRGQPSRAASGFTLRYRPVVSVRTDKSLNEATFPQNDNVSPVDDGRAADHWDKTLPLSHPCQEESPSDVKGISAGIGTLKLVQKSSQSEDRVSKEPQWVRNPSSVLKQEMSSSNHYDPDGKLMASDVWKETKHRLTLNRDGSSSSVSFSNEEELKIETIQRAKFSNEKTALSGRGEDLTSTPVRVGFDISPAKPGNLVTLKAPLHVRNKEKRYEMKRSMEGHNINTLRPGMILLKRYISLGDQVKVVRICQELGKGPGGFYEPGYRDGGKLHLKMMCLGMNWDPQSSKYGDRRPIDDAKPPVISKELHSLVKEAIQDSHAHLSKLSESRNIEDILPAMTPNICIVNFYTQSGRLGLHQDKDESNQSLARGLPVVSFSIGDCAEFLYGDQRDIDKAEKVVLESGDVLIFGGKSRHIFHGVTSILPNTAPKSLLEESNLLPGRLNLTFREY